MGTVKRIGRVFVYAGISIGAGLLVSSSTITNAGASGASGNLNGQDFNVPGDPPQQSANQPASAGSGQTTASSTSARDPGLRAGAPNAGGPLGTLTADQLQYFEDGQNRFIEVDSVSGTAPGEPGTGLGPSFNSNSCGSCHSQPTIGGSSPSTNPQIAAASDYGATNAIPPFITPTGPVREARFPFFLTSAGAVSQTPDGGVHDLFTIAGRQDASGCTMAQPNFAEMVDLNNITFRIPTPLFGAGLIENISDVTIYANMAANASLKQSLGISGHPNVSGNDGTITRFGWKAQNKSTEMFAGEAYNVEMGVTNEVFPDERSLPPASCLYNPTPEDSTNFPASGAAILSDIVAFSNFVRLLAPPAPSSKGIPGNPSAQSLSDGRSLFSQIHCDLCHTPSMQTTSSSLTSALNHQTAALFSDLLVHHMGSGLADNVSQGSAGPDEFRTAPLWGVGQRLFFLHDGRANPTNGGLLMAIQAHSSSGSEAQGVISLFNQLSNQQKQDLLNFLRSL
ncbi:MAG TPA: di-heme oxidoredictase family protein [Candidatus Acidoferrum sp.]|nr:di-heme oxidoredictase family protein [Candidatus Acidoferrum sp.]